MIRLLLATLTAATVHAGSLRKATVDQRLILSSRVANSAFKGVVDELASGTPAHEIHLKVTHLISTLQQRHASVAQTCDQDMQAVRKSSHVDEALSALDEASKKTVQASICMKKNNATIAAKQQEMATLMSKMVLPEMYSSLDAKQSNVTAKLTQLADKHDIRESKFRAEQQKHTDSHETVDSILDILQSFYTTKGMVPPTNVKGAVADLQVKVVPASLLQLVSHGEKAESIVQVSRLLSDNSPVLKSTATMKEMVETNHMGEKKTDSPKKKKVAGTLWKAMWMLKNTMLNDTAIMHERHQLRNDHSKTKMDKLSDELADVVAQIKVLREQDTAIQKRVNESMTEAKQAETRIIECKETLTEASIEQADAEQIANRKKARIDKMSHLCQTQLMHINDELSLGAYVQQVIEHTVQRLHGSSSSSATGSAENN
jgi:hypothetical protein